MKTIFIISLLIVLASCSSKRADRKINDSSWDTLASESYLRWGDTRLQKNARQDHLVVRCYQGKVKEALDLYKKDFIAKSQHSNYFLDIGNCYFIEENYSKAEFFYRMTLNESRIAQMKAVALNNLGLISLQYGNWDKGMEFLKDSMAQGPLYKVPHFNLSQIYLQFGRYDEAIAVLNGPVFKGHKDVDVYFSLANAWLFKGDLKKSEEYFKMIPVDHFKREDIAATYALFLMKSGKMSEAKDVMDERNRSGVPVLTMISQKIEKLLLQRMKEE